MLINKHLIIEHLKLFHCLKIRQQLDFVNNYFLPFIYNKVNVSKRVLRALEKLTNITFKGVEVLNCNMRLKQSDYNRDSTKSLYIYSTYVSKN